ncbi:hypothetical protein ARTHRO9AX_220041 [Arthrobacter sp. 9AX]|nr:hypothetical protein ARTHRO9AX_220041 [Arthrobacter sp. 9AX]
MDPGPARGAVVATAEQPADPRPWCEFAASPWVGLYYVTEA